MSLFIFDQNPVFPISRNTLLLFLAPSFSSNPRGGGLGPECGFARLPVSVHHRQGTEGLSDKTSLLNGEPRAISSHNLEKNILRGHLVA